MAYIQIGDILPRVGDFHRRLEEYYQEHAEDRDDARWHCLLDLISRHDEAIGQALTRYSEESESNVLLTWIQYDPQRRLDESLADATLEPGMSVEDVLRASLQINRELCRIYSQLSTMSSSPRAQELFGGLAKLIEAHEREHSKRMLDSDI
jgi:hypothetical protein